jgi:hypothetical protein
MVYTIIAEARTGGSHLVEALNKELPHFELAAEPWNGAPNNFSDTKDVTNIDWINNYENIIIKEIYDPNMDFVPLINRSDKVLCLYKENWYSQLKSMLYSLRFEEWQWAYKKTDVDNTVSDEEIYRTYYNNFKWHKKDFQNVIKYLNLPSISYEELYYRNGVSQIKEIFNLKDSFEFPIYERHLKDNDGNSIGYEPTPDEPKNLKYLNDIIDLSDRAKTNIMYNFLIEQQELNNKILKEIEVLKNKNI